MEENTFFDNGDQRKVTSRPQSLHWAQQRDYLPFPAAGGSQVPWIVGAESETKSQKKDLARASKSPPLNIPSISDTGARTKGSWKRGKKKQESPLPNLGQGVSTEIQLKSKISTIFQFWARKDFYVNGWRIKGKCLRPESSQRHSWLGSKIHQT